MLSYKVLLKLGILENYEVVSEIHLVLAQLKTHHIGNAGMIFGGRGR